MNNVLFANLQAGTLTSGQPFVGFAEGEFVDFRGRELEIDDEAIPDYLANTLDLIAEFKERGMPGLPIDEQNHNMGKGAGWIVDASEAEVKDSEGRVRRAIQFVAEWTKLGVELVTEKIMTNFSPTFNIANKVIEGGTLTNWPASIDGKGVPLFNAIQLSRGLHALAAPESNVEKGETSMSDKNKQAPPDGELNETPQAPSAPEPAAAPARAQEPDRAGLEKDPEKEAKLMEELFKKIPSMAQSRPDQLAELVQQLSTQMAERQVQTLIEEQQQQWEITELSARLTGGGLRGLPITIPELTNFFLSLDPAQFEAAKNIFSKITSHGLVDFQEYGHGRSLRKQQLPQEYHSHLREALKAGHSLETFFREVGLGDPSNYDLTQFKE